MTEDAQGGVAEDDLPAVFWDQMPNNKDNSDLAAINALIDEQTAEERAESYKVRQVASVRHYQRSYSRKPSCRQVYCRREQLL